MGRKSTDPPPEPAPLEAVLRYRSTLEAEDGPSLTSFKVDFSERPTEVSAWNRQLCDIFVDDYVKRRLPISELKKVPDFFMTYLQTLQDSYRKTKATPEQAQGHEKNAQRTRIAKRKKTVSLSKSIHASQRVNSDIADISISGSTPKSAPCITTVSIGLSSPWKACHLKSLVTTRAIMNRVLTKDEAAT